MAQCIYLFAGPSDNRALSEYVLSLDLRMYPILIQQPEFSVADDPVAYPFSFLSPTKREHLHPYGNPLRISDATDPLIELMRPYLKDNTLVIGRLYCSDDVKTFFTVTKPYFAKIAEWIRNQWHRLPTGQYIGPEAQCLMEGGVQLAFFPPGVPVERRIVGP